MVFRKLDPKLRNLNESIRARRATDNSESAALVLAHGQFDERKLREKGATHIVRLTENIWSIRFRPERLRELHELNEVTYIEAGTRLFPSLINSVPGVKASPEYIGDGVDGSGVVIGIIDYGIDWTLPDFCYKDGSGTRIRYLWDQSLTKENESEHAPAGFDHGVEYDEQRINLALQAWRDGNQAEAKSIVRHDPNLGEPFTAIDGHGTHVTGIACGNGASQSTRCVDCRPGRYAGVAPNAWIVFVHLSRSSIIHRVAQSEGSLGTSADLAEAIAYCYQKADELSPPDGPRVGCVVNLSMGFNGGSHDGESLVERFIDTMLQGKGRALVVAAGNERAACTSYTDVVVPNEPYTFSWRQLTANPMPNEMEIWYSSAHSLSVRLISPENTPTDTVEPGETEHFSLEGIEAFIDSDRFTSLNADARIYIQIAPSDQNEPQKPWTVELKSSSTGPVPFHAWIEREAQDHAQQSQFSGRGLPQQLRATSLTVPATAHRAIAVGGVEHLVGMLDPYAYSDSGAGPTRDGRCKPELVAPALDICSNAVRFDQTTNCTQVRKKGTSMSAPHVAGVVALMLQVNPELTSDQINKILTLSAKHYSGRTGFDPRWGFGVLSGCGALKLVRQNFPAPA